MPENSSPSICEGAVWGIDPAPECSHAVEQTLVRQIVNGQEAGDPPAIPLQVSRDQGRLPVIGMHQVCRPAFVQLAGRQGGGGEGEAGKPDIVVRPIARRFAIGANRRPRAGKVPRIARRTRSARRVWRSAGHCMPEGPQQLHRSQRFPAAAAGATPRDNPARRHAPPRQTPAERARKRRRNSRQSRPSGRSRSFPGVAKQNAHPAGSSLCRNAAKITLPVPHQ